MKSIKKTLSIVLAVTLIFTSGIITIPGNLKVIGSNVATAAQVQKTYTSNLSDPSTWSQSNATATITSSSGKLSIDEPTNNGVYKNFIIDASAPAVADGEYTATLTPNSGTLQRFGIVARYIDTNNWVYVGNEPGKGWFMEWKSGNGTDWYGYFGSQYPLVVGTPLKFNIKYTGKDFIVSINDTQVFDSKATTEFAAKNMAAIPTAAGKVGVISFRWNHKFDVTSSTLAYMGEDTQQSLTYTNNFDSGTEVNLYDKGLVTSDTAISAMATYSGMSGKILAAKNTGVNQIFYFSDMPDVADGTFEAKFSIDEGATEQFGIVVRYKDAAHLSMICRDQNGWLWDGYNGGVEVWGSYLNKPAKLEAGKTYDLKVTFIGDTYEVYLDGTQIYTSTSGGALPTAAGKIGFRSYFGAKSLNIDEVKVTDSNNTVVYTRNFDSETTPVANMGAANANVPAYSFKSPLPGFTGKYAKITTTNGSSQVVDSKSPLVMNGTYSAKLQLNSGYNDAGLLFRHQDESNWSSVRTDNVGNWTLVGKNAGVDVTRSLTSVPQPLSLNTPHTLQIDYSNDDYKLSVDGVQIYSGTQLGMSIVSGSEGFVASSSTVLTTYVDDMQVIYKDGDVYTPPKPTTYIRNYDDGITGTWNKIDGTALSPKPAITNNKLELINLFGEIYDNDSIPIQDGYYTLKFRTSLDNGRIGFIFRYLSPSQPYAMIYYDTNGHWGWQTDGSHYGQFTSSGPDIAANTDYTVKIKYIGKNVKVWLNDVLAVSGSADFPVAEAKVGLRSWFNAKDITISQLSQQAYIPPTPPTPTELNPIIIASDKLNVSMDNRFPAVRSYTWLGSEVQNATMQGQSDFLYNVKINGNDGFAIVNSVTKTGTDTIVYNLDVPVLDDNTDEPTGNVNVGVTYIVAGNIVNMDTHINSEPTGYKVRTLEFPNQKLVSVSSSNPDAQGASSWVTGEWNKMDDEFYTNDVKFGNKLIDQTVGSKLRTYGFVSDGQLAATIMNDVVEAPAKVIMNIEAESGGANKQLSMWNGAWTARGDLIDDGKLPPKFDFSSKIMITPDQNNDGTADWKDAAIAFRNVWSQNLLPGADQINKYVSYIAMNFNSLAQNPFLRTLDNAKKFYNLYDGFGQLILEKGYQAEGHDDSHPDVAGHFGIREGGLKDFNTFVDEGLKYNVKVGVHTNIDAQDPDGYYAKPENWGSSNSNYDWVDPTYPTDRAKDLLSGELERRYTQLREEVPNLAMVYDDIYSGAGWHGDVFANILQKKLGFWFATEFAGPLEQNVIWTHWGTDPYYPSKTDGSLIIRFIKNQYQDTFQAPSPYVSTLLRGMLQAGVGTWQGRTDNQNGIDLFYNNNLLTKYMQHFPIMNLTYDSTGMDKSVVFGSGVVAELDEYHTDASNANLIVGTASLKKDGKVIAKYDVLLHKDWGDTGSGQLDVDKQQSQLFLPWDPQIESKIYYWNPKGGSTTWDMPNSWNGLTSVEMYKLSDTGRVWDRTLTVTNGKVTIDNTTIGVPYIIYKSKTAEQNADIQKAGDWGFGGQLKDPGFDSGEFASWHKTSTTNATAGNITVEHDFIKNSYLKVTGQDDARISQTVTGLKPGKTYTASVWVDINNSPNHNADLTPSTSDRNVSIGVYNYGGPELTSSISSSTIKNLEEPSKFKKTYYQRLKVDFTADAAGTATLYLKADATTVATSNVWFDDVKLWENPGKTDFGTHYFYEDFENVSEGYGPFMFKAGWSGGQTHLAEKVSDEQKAADPYISQPMTYVIDGSYSLKSNEQDFINNSATPLVAELLGTVPSTLKLKPHTSYKVGLKYEANKGGLYQLSAKSRSNGPTTSVLLSTQTGTGKSNIPGFTLPIIKSTGTADAVLEFNTGNYSDYYIAIESVKTSAAPKLSAIDVVLVVDDLYVDDLTTPPTNHAPVIQDIAPIDVKAGDPITFTVEATDADNGDTITLSVENMPIGATFDAVTGVFEWTQAVKGDYTVTLKATDSHGELDETTVIIHVTEEITPPANRAPVIQDIDTINAKEGDLITFTVVATDADGDAITFSASNMPTGATFNALTGEFKWVSAVKGNYNHIKFEATDGKVVSSIDVKIHVKKDK